jgi:hypothetical protein
MNDEYASLMKNSTWDFVSLPPWRKNVKSNKVYKIKIHFEGTIDQYKV